MRAFKAGLELMPGMLERIEKAVVSRREEELLALERNSSPLCLARYRHKLFSQFGQDGMIAEIFRRIGEGGRRFVEIGTAPVENNTCSLLLRGWSGLWIDAALPPDDRLPAPVLQKWQEGRIECDRRFVTRENVLDILHERGFDRDVDFLGIDVDRNTFHIFDACLAVRPRVFSVEYNSQLPASLDWVMPYEPDGIWDKSMNYGGSLKAFERRGAEEGYALVGCDLSGTDAFFVRREFCDGVFLAPFTAERHWEPARFWLDAVSSHERSFLSGTSRG